LPMHQCCSNFGMRHSQLLHSLSIVSLLRSLPIPHPLKICLTPNQPMPSFILLVAPVGRIYVRIIHKLVFWSKQCAFLEYNTHHKGYKCLNIATGPVYISHDVIFDENVFPFSSLHVNAGARLQLEISLLPAALLDSMSFGGSSVDTDLLPKSADAFVQPCSLQDSPGHHSEVDRSILTSGG
jgi:hypothetical protein